MDTLSIRTCRKSGSSLQFIPQNYSSDEWPVAQNKMNFLTPPLSLQSVPVRASGQEACWIHSTALGMLQIAHFLTLGPQLLYVQKQLLIPSKTGSLNRAQRVPQNILHHPLLNEHHSEPASLRQLEIETGERISHNRKSTNLNQVSPSSFSPIPPSLNTF